MEVTDDSLDTGCLAKWRPTVLGYTAAASIFIFQTLSAACVQGLQRLIPDFQLSFFRYAAQLTLPVLLLKIQNVPLHIEPPHYVWTILLGPINVVYNVVFFAAVSYIPLSAADGIFNISLMVSVAVYYRIIFDNPIGIVTSTGLAISSLGILCVSQPDLIFGKDPLHTQFFNGSSVCTNSTANVSTLLHTPEHDEEQTGPLLSKHVMGYMFASTAGVPVASIYMITGITLKQVSPVALTVWMAIVGLPLSFIISMYFEEPVLPVQLWDIVLVVCHAMSMTMANLAIRVSCQLLDPMRMALFGSLTPVAALVLQYTVMKHILPGHRNWIEVVGVLAITIGVGLVAIFDYIKYRHNSREWRVYLP